MAKAKLQCIWGRIPEDAENLLVVGAISPYQRTVPWATVWGDSGLVIDEFGRPLEDLLWHQANLAACPDYTNSPRRFLPKFKSGIYFNAMMHWCRFYYHWICDVLPRIQRAISVLPERAKIIIPDNLPESFWQSLHCLGIDKKRLVVFRGRCPWRVRQLVHIPPVTMTGDHSRESLEDLRQAVFGHVGLDLTQKPFRKIYISRKAGSERSIVNEAELLPLLRQRGFEVVRCEELSFPEQVRLFRESSEVVGPHGGGLTNLVWCQPGTAVFEIFGSDSVRRCYWSISSVLGLRHQCGVVDYVGNDGPMHVDPLLFEAGLHAVSCKDMHREGAA